ncbi:MAG: MBL fold metallo-hydrolase [Planctomycetota bacterium]
MFGNAPRALWSRWSRPDDQNRIDLACRALLVAEPERTILFETGIGAFFAPEMQRRYGVQESGHVLLESLAEAGFSPAEIDVVVLSHLHFDHAGGLLSAYRPDGPSELVFPRAQFVVGADAWERAKKPHPRDRASFVPELQDLLEQSGRLRIAERGRSEVLGDAYRLHVSHGHTPGMLLAEIPGRNGPLVFAGDLIPGLPWVRRAITMGYDRFPELLVDEKTALLEDLCERNGRLFLTHDPTTACCRVGRDEDGRPAAFDLSPVLVGEEA